MSKAYSEVVFWKKNVFTVPTGFAGKSFVGELARLIQAYSWLETRINCTEGNFSGIQTAATEAIPHIKSKGPCSLFRGMLDYVERRWHRLPTMRRSHHGYCSYCIHGCTNQQCLPSSNSTQPKSDTAHSFTKLMFEGNCKAATLTHFLTTPEVAFSHLTHNSIWEFTALHSAWSTCQ